MKLKTLQKVMLTLLMASTYNLAFAQPANDDCANAVEVFVDGGAVDFTTIDAITDGPFHPNSPCPSSASDSIFSDVWYVLNAQANADLIWSLCGMADYDSRIAVYNAGATCPLTDDDLMACNEDGPTACTNFESELEFSVVAGETYLLRIGGFGSEEPGAQGSGSFTMVEAPAGPDNNNCDNAALIMLGSGQDVSNVGATTDGPEHPNDQICFGFNDTQCQNDIWFTFTAPNSTTVQWSTCNTVNWDPRLVVYGPNVSCPVTPDDMIACDDATPGCANFTNILNFDVVAGETYLLRMGGYNGATGSGTMDLIEIVPPEPPTNDLCEDAEDAWILTQEEYEDDFLVFQGTTVNSTISPAPVIDPTCGTGQGSAFPDIWWKFNTLGNESITVRYFSFDENVAFYLEVFESCEGDTLMGNSCFFYSPDDVTNLLVDSITQLPPEPTELYIRISSWIFYTPGEVFFQLTAPITTATNEVKFPGEAELFPNPVSDNLMVNLNLREATETDLIITNSLGQQIKHQSLGKLSHGEHSTQIDVGDLPDGIYFLSVKGEGSRTTMRFVKS